MKTPTTAKKKSTGKKPAAEIVLLLTTVLSIAVVILREVLTNLKSIPLPLVVGLAAILPLGMFAYFLHTHCDWVHEHYPILQLRGTGVLIFLLLVASVVATGVGWVDYCVPTGTVEISVGDETDDPLMDVIVLLWDPVEGGAIGSAGLTDGTGKATFKRIRFGSKRICLLRRLADQTWEMMELTLDVKEQSTNFHRKFKPDKKGPAALPTLHFTSGESKVDAAEWKRLLNECPSPSRPGGRLFVLGCTDTKGDDDYNESLGADRATVVALLLKKLPGQHAEIRGFSLGKSWQRSADFAGASVEQVKKMNRRVELVFVP